MANIIQYRRAWQAENKRKKVLKPWEDDYYVSKEWGRLRRSFFGITWDASKKKYGPKTKNMLCVACLDSGIMEESVVADHIIQRIKGGADALDNLQGLCSRCHDKKSVLESKKK